VWADNIYQTLNIGKFLMNSKDKMGFEIIAAIPEMEKTNANEIDNEINKDKSQNENKGEKVIINNRGKDHYEQQKEDYHHHHHKHPIILLFGNESGLPSKYMKHIDNVISIKPKFKNKFVDSVNLGVATGIIFDRLTNNRKQPIKMLE